jgi:hypothetical protein
VNESAYIDHLQIAVSAVGETAARVFPGNLLGLIEIPKSAPLAARDSCWFQIGAQRVHVGIGPAFQPACKAHLAIASSSSV